MSKRTLATLSISLILLGCSQTSPSPSTQTTQATKTIKHTQKSVYDYNQADGFENIAKEFMAKDGKSLVEHFQTNNFIKNKKFLLVEYDSVKDMAVDGKITQVAKDIKESLTDMMIDNHIKVRKNDLLKQRRQNQKAQIASCDINAIEYDTYLGIEVKKATQKNTVTLNLRMIDVNSNDIPLKMKPITVVNVPDDVIASLDTRNQDKYYKGYDFFPFDETDSPSQMGQYLAKNLYCIAEQRGVTLSLEDIFIDESKITPNSYESSLVQQTKLAMKEQGLRIVDTKSKDSFVFKAECFNGNPKNLFFDGADGVVSKIFYTSKKKCVTRQETQSSVNTVKEALIQTKVVLEKKYSESIKPIQEACGLIVDIKGAQTESMHYKLYNARGKEIYNTPAVLRQTTNSNDAISIIGACYNGNIITLKGHLLYVDQVQIETASVNLKNAFENHKIVFLVD